MRYRTQETMKKKALKTQPEVSFDARKRFTSLRLPDRKFQVKKLFLSENIMITQSTESISLIGVQYNVTQNWYFRQIIAV